MTGKMVSNLARTMDRTTNFEYNFLTIYRYL